MRIAVLTAMYLNIHKGEVLRRVSRQRSKMRRLLDEHRVLDRECAVAVGACHALMNAAVCEIYDDAIESGRCGSPRAEL
jgi:hypothetical protein